MMMQTARFGVSAGFSALVAGSVLLAALGACSKSNESFDDGGPPGGYFQTLPDGAKIYVGTGTPESGTGNSLVMFGMNMPEAGADATMTNGPPTAIGSVNAADCQGCLFPQPGAAMCNNAPAISIVYPADKVILPPNLNVLSVQWTPYGGGYQHFSVNFSAPPNTDWHVFSSCANQTTDEQAGSNPSGGCELTVDPVTWSKLVQI